MGCGTDGAGGSSKWAGEERASALALASFEVTIAGGDAVLAGRKLIAVHRDAHGAAGLAPFAAGGGEDFGQAFGDGLALHVLRPGDHHHANVRTDLAAFQQTGGDAQIADTGIGAASDEDDVDGVTGKRLAAFEVQIVFRPSCRKRRLRTLHESQCGCRCRP